MKTLIFTLITLSFASSYAKRIEGSVYRGVASEKAHDHLRIELSRVEEYVHSQQEETSSSDLGMYKMRAEKGEVEAQYVLGRWHYEGIGGAPQDYKIALYWIGKAAMRGDRNAQSILGYMYDSGIEVSRDYQWALHWFEKAAKSGDGLAQHNLAGVYFYGRKGIPQNYKKALEWYKISAKKVDTGDLGGILSSDMLGDLYYFAGEDESNLKNYKNRSSWVVQMKDKFGLLVSKEDKRKAFHWYMKAAEQGYAPSQHAVGVMLFNGYGVTKNIAASHYWLTQAANQGHAVAKEVLKDSFWLNAASLLHNYNRSKN